MKAELVKIEDRGDQYNWPSVCWTIGSGRTRFDGWPKWKMQWLVDRINDGTIKVPEGSPTPKPPEPLPEVAKLPEGTKVIVTWRYADGHEDESGNTIWLGNIVESFGPSDTCFKPRVDGTLREKAPPGYAQPVRWRLAEEARP